MEGLWSILEASWKMTHGVLLGAENSWLAYGLLLPSPHGVTHTGNSTTFQISSRQTLLLHPTLVKFRLIPSCPMREDENACGVEAFQAQGFPTRFS